MKRFSIEWEPMVGHPGSWVARCGRGVVGHISFRNPGYSWTITAVSMKWVGKINGESVRLGAAKNALERNWDRWLDKFQLEKA